MLQGSYICYLHELMAILYASLHARSFDWVQGWDLELPERRKHSGGYLNEAIGCSILLSTEIPPIGQDLVQHI